ncbi:DMT family transporter [Fusibacter ferrireducens]|uniref:DMT family transporter n=1 Tax=Fusibacter ferrireducens TaxID=2785058 RepID=A0ABR9ZR56_9FIRM|nr:DMT family transporter [Fusibacter ferrireducens]MBF4692461.1 DMT family transporter [Fusibacter ferrireducens]
MEKFKGRFYLAVGFIFAGTAVIAARFVSGFLGPFTITAVSLLAALVILVPFNYLKIQAALKLMKKTDWLMISLQAFFGIFLFRAFLLFGLQKISSTEAGVLIGTAPILTSILAYTLLKEKVTLRTIIGILCAVLGIILLQGAHFSNFTLSQSIGTILVLGAAACESLFNILSRFHSLNKATGNMDRMPPVVQSLLVSAIAFIFCLLPALAEHPVSSLIALDWIGWLSLLWYGLFVTILSYVLWYAGIKRCTAHTAAAFSGLMPFTSMILSHWVLSESITSLQWIGGGLVILGVIIIGISQSYESETPEFQT